MSVGLLIQVNGVKLELYISEITKLGNITTIYK